MRVFHSVIQWAENMRMARGRGSDIQISFQLREKILSSMAFMGLPCPMKSMGSFCVIGVSGIIADNYQSFFPLFPSESEKNGSSQKKFRIISERPFWDGVGSDRKNFLLSEASFLSSWRYDSISCFCLSESHQVDPIEPPVMLNFHEFDQVPGAVFPLQD